MTRHRQGEIDDRPTSRPTGRDRVETMDYAAMMRRMIRAWGERVADADYPDLADMIDARQLLDDAIANAVHASREKHGRSWADIAMATGTTRQAAQQRWGDPSRRPRAERD